MTKKWNRFLLPILTVLLVVLVVGVSAVAMAGVAADVTVIWPEKNSSEVAYTYAYTYGSSPVGGTDYPGEVTASWLEGEETKTQTLSVTFSEGILTAGTTEPKWPDGYSLSNPTKQMTFNRKPVTISWEGVTTSFTYDGNDQVPKPNIGGVINGDVVEATVNGAVKIGQSTATVTGLSNPNYVLPSSVPSCDFIINRAEITFSWTGGEAFTYTGQEQGPTAEYSAGRIGQDDVGVSQSGWQTAANASGGKYTATAILIGEAKDNYVLSGTTTKEFSIGQATATLTWSGDSVEYNGNQHGPTVEVTGVNSDELTATCTYDGTAVGENYTAEVTQLNGTAASNYKLPATKTKTYSITPKTVGLTWSGNSVEYNGSANGPTATVTGTIEGDGSNVSVGEYTYTGTNVGSNYTATATTLTGTGSNNYQLPANASTTYSITQAPLTIAAQAWTYTYNTQEQGPEGTYTSGFDTYIDTSVVQNLKGNDTLTSITISGKKKDYKENGYADAIVPSGAIIMNGETPTTANYDISYGKATLTINKANLIIKPDEKQGKVFDEKDPETLTYTLGFGTNTPAISPATMEASAFQGEISGYLSRESSGHYSDISATNVPDGEKAGDYAFLINTLTPSGNVTIALMDNAPKFTISKRPVTFTKEAQNKNYGAADPAITYTITGIDSTRLDLYKAWLHTADLAREEGEAVGDYSYNFDVIKDVTTNSLLITKTNGKTDDSKWTVTPDGVVTGTAPVFTINPVFAGTVTFTNPIMTSRTQSMGFTVAGITATLKDGEQPTLALDVPATVVAPISQATVAKDGGYTLTITGTKVEDPLMKKSYISYLAPGSYTATLSLPTRSGEAKKVAATTVPVKADSIKSMSINNDNAANNRRDLYGSEGKDTISFGIDKAFETETRDWTAGQDQEIVQLTILVDGKSIYPAPHYIEVTSLDSQKIQEDLHNYVVEEMRSSTGDRLPVSITATVVSPDLTPTSVTREFNYDDHMIKLTDENITELTNRAYSFKVALPETAKINKVSVTGFNEIDPDNIKYEGTDAAALAEGYGRTATIPLSFNIGALPIASACVLTIETEDYAGNKAEYVMNGIPIATTGGVGIFRIEPLSYGSKDEYTIRETNVIRLCGMGTGYEMLNISLAARSGSFRRSYPLQVPSSDTMWNPAMDDYWELTIGDRKSDKSLREQMADFPIGIPIDLTIGYRDVLGGGYHTILLYDEDVQEVTLLTPPYPGMRVMTGYTEPMSKVTVTWSGGSKQAYVNPWGLFIIEFPEGIIDPEITIEVTDVAGNSMTQKITIPGRKSEVDMKRAANTMGALIQDDTGMIKGIATPVVLSELDEGAMVVPILVGNYFKVGTMTIRKDSDGKLSFTPAIDAAFATEGAKETFNIFTKKPTAEEVNAGGMDYRNGYTPDEKTEIVWFTYETQATLAEDQMTLSNDPDTVNVALDDEFNRMQAVGN